MATDEADPVRVLVVNDSATVRALLRATLEISVAPKTGWRRGLELAPRVLAPATAAYQYVLSHDGADVATVEVKSSGFSFRPRRAASSRVRDTTLAPVSTMTRTARPSITASAQ